MLNVIMLKELARFGNEKHCSWWGQTANESRHSFSNKHYTCCITVQ